MILHLSRCGHFGCGGSWLALVQKMDVDVVVKSNPHFSIGWYVKRHQQGYPHGFFIAAVAYTHDDFGIGHFAFAVDGYFEAHCAAYTSCRRFVGVAQVLGYKGLHGFGTPGEGGLVYKVLIVAFFFHKFGLDRSKVMFFCSWARPAQHTPLAGAQKWDPLLGSATGTMVPG